MDTNVKLIISGLSVYLLISGCSISDSEHPVNPFDKTITPASEIENAFINQLSFFTVTVKGTVTRIIKDCYEGEKNQRFTIQMPNKQTLLIVHNTEIAPPVTGITSGSEIFVHGEYVWDSEGGVVNWTHHDPDGIRENGWILFNEEYFQ